MTSTSVNALERDLMRHALGLSNNRGVATRNHFCADDGDKLVWRGLVDRGLAIEWRSSAVPEPMFALTNAGVALVLQPHERLDAPTEARTARYEARIAA